ncbi:NahK/ErcS family hybrid sensor histidine kinase/response regulator [Rhodopseudomonas palustris]|uniref:hybrid sensor histidine kinase/response regulator n=1 Tax=Rhodopseudomonas palustris TaxID=1076 RepID=UPI002ACD4FDB|nr:NahK/ErcS family hybrid sensor histidine kinase/response regulator [Rhodopseudomonas palustris]WQG99174.1 NahK/ErcS family hybrid sensor histidine kinase/response regulator [Rhodopseudomonas palustris]
MLHDWGVIAAALAYIGLLFGVASYGDRLSQRQRERAGGLIYPLSLAIYCTSWTFFGSVGFASRTSTDFLAIYVGPILLIAVFTPLLRRVIRLAKSQNITSIADFIAARYGKSQKVAATVAIIAIIGSVPYIALQLKAVASSLQTILGDDHNIGQIPIVGDMALVVAMLMALFAVLFGARQASATEHQHGLMLAIATESIVKLVAFLAAGIFVTFWMFSPADLIERAMKMPEAVRALEATPSPTTFLTMTVLSFCAFLMLPRQFYVGVVENTNDAEVSRARWMFPLYLIAINLFVIPIALAGLVKFPFGAVDSDMFVLALPIEANAPLLSFMVFIGGLSAATAMVIVECVALAVMVSNDLVMPLVLKRHGAPRNDQRSFGGFLLMVRRVAIFAILILAYLYYRALGNTQLAAIGLLSFAAIAQFAPAFFGGLVWRRATAQGAIGGMMIGFAAWAYTLFIPSFMESSTAGLLLLQHGPWGIESLRPQALFGAELPPLVHGVVWSLSLNLFAYVVLSLLSRPSSIDRLQAEVFVPDTLTPMTPAFRRWRTTVTVQDILGAVGQYLGPDRARESFRSFAVSRRLTLDPAAPADFELLKHAEHLIASSIGAASSRLVLSLLLRRRTVSAEAALKLLDDSHAALHFNREILQTALNHVRQGIAVFNPDLQLICSNRQFGEILGLPPHIIQIGIPLIEILEFLSSAGAGPADAEAQTQMRLASYTTEGEPFLERLHDRHLVIEVRANRMPDGGLVITFSDVTPSFEAAEALERANATLERRVRERTEELTRLNSQLALAKSTAEEANISKTRFLAAASHDILQPLNAARLYATSLVERQNGGEDSRLVENIDESLEAIEEIIGALLDISRLDAGAMTPSLTNFVIGDLMRSLEIEFSPTARAKGLQLTFVPCSLPVQSDRLMLRRLMQNLISNAIKYTPQGRVLVGCRRQGDALKIGIYDTGVGVPILKRGEIFKEFHRLEQGARIARGLGLGLSIVERLARVLNHGIALDSNRSGGSCFSVTVPVAAVVNHTTAVTSATPLSRASMSGSLVVCIENDPAILDGMKTLLTTWDASVIAVADPDAAIKAIEAAGRRITGLLVDYHLDRGNGIAAIRDIRQRFGVTIPAILITADRSPGVRAAARQEEIAVLNKPVKAASLRALLNQWHAQQTIAAAE